MTLREYLFKNRMTVIDFAKSIGYHRIHLSLVMSGKRNPKASMLKVIEMQTRGEVKASEVQEFA